MNICMGNLLKIHEPIYKIGTLVRDRQEFFSGEIIGSFEYGGWVVYEVLWENKVDGKYTTIEFIKDLDVFSVN